MRSDVSCQSISIRIPNVNTMKTIMNYPLQKSSNIKYKPYCTAIEERNKFGLDDASTHKHLQVFLNISCIFYFEITHCQAFNVFKSIYKLIYLNIPRVITDGKDVDTLQYHKPTRVETLERKFTKLHYAIIKKSIVDVERLIRLGANVNQRATKLITTLSLAIESNEQIIDILLKNNVDYNFKSKTIRINLLINAVKFKRTKLVRLFLKSQKFVEIINYVDELGKTALMYACENGYNEIVDILLSKKAVIDVQDELGRDAGFLAAERGYTNILYSLVYNGYTVLTNDLTILYNVDSPNTIIAYAKTERPDEDLLINLIEIASNLVLDQTDRFENTLLHLLVDLEYVRAVLALVKRGVDIHVKNMEGKSALDFGVTQKNMKIICTLIDHNILDASRLFYSQIWSNDRRNVRALLKAGVKVNLYHIITAIDADNSVKSPKTRISSFNNSMIRILIENFDLDMQSAVAEFVVIYAIDTNKFQLVRHIWEAGFDGDNIVNGLQNNKVKLSFNFPKLLSGYLNKNVNLFGKEGLFSVQQSIKENTCRFLYYLKKRQEGSVRDLLGKGVDLLEMAVYYKMEDVATILLQYGVKPSLEKTFLRIIDEEFSVDFKNLIEEVKGDGLKTLQQMARIAVRESNEFFEAMEISPIRKKLLEFRSKSHNLEAIDLFNKTPFHHLIQNNNLELAKSYIKNVFLCDKFDEDVIDFELIDLENNRENPEFLSEYIEILVSLQYSIKYVYFNNIEELLESKGIENIDLTGIQFNILDLAILFGNQSLISSIISFRSKFSRNGKFKIEHLNCLTKFLYRWGTNCNYYTEKEHLKTNLSQEFMSMLKFPESNESSKCSLFPEKICKIIGDYCLNCRLKDLNLKKIKNPRNMNR